MIYIKWNKFTLHEHPFGFMSKIIEKINNNHSKMYYIDWNCKFYLGDDKTKSYYTGIAYNRDLKVLKWHYQTVNKYNRIVLDEVSCY